ncbi:MAG: TonB family protein [Acidobacteria bacterium]|nr:TonB family protein [Acidobacteriota bacterium]
MFTTPWMTASPDRRAAGRKRAWILTSSLLAHGLALATLSGFEAWQVPAVAEPPIADVFVVQLPPPPLPAAQPHQDPKTGGPKPRTETLKAPVTPATLAPLTPAVIQPHTVPEHVPAASAEPLPAEPQAGPAADPFGNGLGGNGNGKGTGAGDGPGGDDGPLAIGGAISRPQIIPGTRVEPHYTEAARLAHVQGVVILRAVIDEGGNVIDLHVEKALPFGLDEAAVKAVGQWRFTPALLKGRPVKVYFDVTVKFEIR